MKPGNKCPKCGGEFEEGLLGETNRDITLGLNWGTNITKIGIFKLSKDLENKKSTKTYRCKNCGYLESYAN